jgi:hypothetical protein
MDVSVAEFARARGISRQRALAMIHAGQIAARKVGRAWVIDQRELGHRHVVGRPLSERMAGILIAAMSQDELELDSQERYFVNRYRVRMQKSDDPVGLLHSWMRSRQIRVANLAANRSDIPDMAADERVVPSGVSDERSALSAASEFEGYVASNTFDDFVRAHLLLPSVSPNVRIHIVAALPARPAPLGLTISDLTDWNRPREDGRVIELLEGIEWR